MLLSLLCQAAKADALLSQLAETAAQERALLKECSDLLAHAASLEVGEHFVAELPWNFHVLATIL